MLMASKGTSPPTRAGIDEKIAGLTEHALDLDTGAVD